MKLKKIIAVLTATSSMFIGTMTYADDYVVDSMSDVDVLADATFSELYLVAQELISENPECSDLVSELVEYYLSDSMFCAEYMLSPETAIDDFVRAAEIDIKIENDASTASPNASSVVGSGLGTLYYCYVDSTIMQSKNNWCGVASTLMALTGIETYNSGALISSYTRPTQSTIASSVCGDDGTAVVSSIKNYLNTKITSSKYTYKKVTSSVSKTQIKEYIIDSLSNNRPVILHAKPYQAFGYYSGVSITDGHYIVVEDYNSYSGTFTVADCSNINNGYYQGRHTGLTLDEIYNSLYSTSNGVEGRYIIYA